MPRKTYYGAEARAILKKGVDALGDAVKTTLGPKGRNAVIFRGWGVPIVTKDGVTVAKEIEAEDKGEQMGVELVRQAAMKTNDAVGDGTTTSTVLAQEIIRLAFEKIEADPTLDVHAFRLAMEARAEAICAELDKQAISIDDDRERLCQVATISANNDPVVGKLIADLMADVGKEGVVTVDEGEEVGVKVERVEGMQFARGFISRFMMTDHERLVAELGDPVVIVTDYRVSTAPEIISLIKPAIESGRKNIFLIADALEGDALTVVAANGPMFKGNFNVVAVTPPGYGDRKKEMLQDICALTGATLIGLEGGRKLDSVTEADYGGCARVTVEQDLTTIVGGKGDADAIKKRISLIKAELKKATSDFDKEKIKERLGKLQGGVAVIKIGGATESEVKEKKYLIEDAVSAVKAAMQEGIVAGGGIALGRAALSAVRAELDAQEMSAASALMTVACCAPYAQIVRNAGKDNAVAFPETGGYDAKKDVMVEDMIAVGIVDPVSVTKSALRNAVSVAGALITTETLVVELPAEKSSTVQA